VVEGSVRRAAGQARVTVQLIDAVTNNHIWAERYDRQVEHVFAVQSEIAEAVASAICPAVGDAEQQRTMRNPPSSLSAWETYQRGRWHFSKCTPVGNEQARQLFHQATAIDSGFSPAYVGLSQTYIRDALFYGTRPFSEATRLAEAEARKALTIDPNDSAAQTALAHAFLTAGNFNASLDSVDRALSLNRNLAAAYEVRGALLILTGRYADGRADALISLRLNPRDPLSAVAAALLPVAYYLEGNYEATIDAANKCLAHYPDFAPPRRYLVAALGQLGRREEAATALRDLLTVAPDLSNAMIRNRPPYISLEYHEHMLDGLLKAGWQG
jgi:adenylate cyclase